jgi:hypothetical protein
LYQLPGRFFNIIGAHDGAYDCRGIGPGFHDSFQIRLVDAANRYQR